MWRRGGEEGKGGPGPLPGAKDASPSGLWQMPAYGKRRVRKLAGYDDVYRVRAGRYRIRYSVDRRELVIIILKVGHRREVYR